jgi:hypothetical protein
MSNAEKYIIEFLLGIAFGGSICTALLIDHCQQTYEEAYKIKGKYIK